MKKSLVQHFKKELIQWRETRRALDDARKFEEEEFKRLKKVCGYGPELGNRDCIEDGLKRRIADEFLKE